MDDDNLSANVQDGAVDDDTKFIMAMCSSSKTLGIACYDELSNTIFADSCGITAEDAEETLMNIKTCFNPSLFLIHPRMIANKSMLDTILMGPDGTPDFFKYKVLKSSNWNEKTALQLILKKLIVRDDQFNRHIPTNIYQTLSCKIDLDNEQVRQALGALLSFMQSTVFHLDDGRVVVSSVKPFPLENYMRIDKTSLRGLQIFSEELHPNVIQGPGRNKEGFSLFGLFDRTHSLPGRAKLREWMSKPFYDRGKILHRQQGIALVLNPANFEFIQSVTATMKHIHDIPRLVLRIKKVQATCQDWCRLYTSLMHGQQIMDNVLSVIRTCESTAGRGYRTDTAESEYLRHLLGELNLNHVREVVRALTVAIDFEMSESQGAITMRQGYDQRLDQLRALYDNLEEHLVAAAHKVLDAAPLLQNVSVEYVPQIGYLVAVQQSSVHLLQRGGGGGGGGGSVSSHSMVNKIERLSSPTTAGVKRPFSMQSTTSQPQSTLNRLNVIPSNHPHERKTDHFCSGNYGSSYFDDDTGLGQALFSAPTPRNKLLSSRSALSHIVESDNEFPSLPSNEILSPAKQSGPGATGRGREQQQGFQFVYSQDDMHYFKHPVVYALDDSIGDVKSDIVDRQKSLLLHLEESLLEFEPALQQMAHTLSTLDAIISLGTIAKEQRLVRPELLSIDDATERESVVIVKNGRHLLQELTVDSFVPNDVFLSDQKNVALITGPNSSGKSVYLKQVGLIVYLAHIGSYVPCDRAILSLTDAIYTRIHNQESVSNPLSAFAIDLMQMNRMLKYHTKHSLCLIDEFGKGTTPVDGIALLAASVRHFVQHKGKAIFALHFTEIIHPSILTEQQMLSINCFCMETHIAATSKSRYRYGGSETLISLDDTDADATAAATSDNELCDALAPVPLFKLKLGVSKSSEGLPCARQAGVPEKVLLRAAEIKKHIEDRSPIGLSGDDTKGYRGLLKNAKQVELLRAFLTVKNWMTTGGSEQTETDEGGKGVASVDGLVRLKKALA